MTDEGMKKRLLDFCGREGCYTMQPDDIVRFTQEQIKAATESKAEGNGTMRANYLQRFPGGVCFAHGGHTEMQCPQWPKCVTDPQKLEYMDQKYCDAWFTKLAAMRDETLQPSIQGEQGRSWKEAGSPECTSECDSLGHAENCPYLVWFEKLSPLEIIVQANHFIPEHTDYINALKLANDVVKHVKAAHSITSERIAQIAKDYSDCDGSSQFDIKRAIELALREAGVRVEE